MTKKAVFTTGTTGVEFTDEQQVANRDNAVLPRMVNADITEKAKAANQVTSPQQ